MRNFIYCLLSLALLLSATTVASAQASKEWTMIVYLVGSDLESNDGAGTTDLAEMKSVSSTSNVNIVVLTGGAKEDGWRTPKSFLIKDGVQTALNFQPVSSAMSNPQNLTKFIDWAVTNYPGEKYFLDMWNHGMAIRGYGYDEVSNGQLTVPQIKAAIAATTFIQGDKRFELIGFDACLMAAYEAQVGLKDYGEYYVASEETEPGHGWNYKPVIEAMQNGTVSDGYDLGVVVVDGFKAQGLAQMSGTTTLSVTDLTLMDGLTTKLETLFAKIKSDNKFRSLQQARAASQEYSKSIKKPFQSEDMVDIGDLMKKLKIKDASLAAEADSVLAQINNVVLYEHHDAGRPNSTGMTMFIPHNKLADTFETRFFIAETYKPIDFSSTVRDYVANDYFRAAVNDRSTPTGQQVDNFGGVWGGGASTGGRSSSAENIAAIRVNHANDLEQVQVVLIEEFPGSPDEFILLGSTFPDTAVFVAADEEIFAYEFDDEWLGINGFPAYISDIHEYEVVNDAGETELFTQVHIPALLNPTDTSEGKTIMLGYRYDENFNVTMESILPESYDANGTLIPGKERINLVPGDVVQLTYESFNEVTDEQFFVIDDDAVITIENGNEDLMLEYDRLFPGEYKIGFHLEDHSRNDTLIFDSKVFTVIIDGVVENFADNNIAMYPNPASVDLTIDNRNFTGGSYKVRLLDVNGRQVYQGRFEQQRATIPTGALPNGLYAVEMIHGTKVYADKVLISRR